MNNICNFCLHFCQLFVYFFQTEEPKQLKRPVEKDEKGQLWVVEWWPMEGPLAEDYKTKENFKKSPLRRCGGCKQALYCSEKCQKIDWNVSLKFLQKIHFVPNFSSFKIKVELRRDTFFSTLLMPFLFWTSDFQSFILILGSS